MMQAHRTAAPQKGTGPKRPPSYSEGADEAPKTLDEEPVDVEESTPAEERSSVEGVKPAPKTPPVFED